MLCSTGRRATSVIKSSEGRTGINGLVGTSFVIRAQHAVAQLVIVVT
jgi:hypothetical protein